MAAFLAMLPGLIAAGVGAAQGIAGAVQAGEAKKQKFEIPSAAKDALNASKALAAQTKLPGQDIYETQLGERTANMTKNIERMGGGGSGLGTLANVYAQEVGAKRNLAVDAARYYAGNQAQLRQTQQWYSGLQNQQQAHKFNQMDKEDAASSALIQAGMSNTFKGASDIAGVHYYDKLFGGNGAYSNSQNYWNATGNVNPNNIPAGMTPEMLKLLMGQIKQ